MLFLECCTLNPVEPKLSKDTPKFSKTFFSFFLLFSIFFSFRLNIAPSFTFEGFPLSLSLILLAGYIFGPQNRFWFGLVWTLCEIFSIRLSEFFVFPSIGNNALLFAPIIGYMGGTSLFSKRKFFHHSFVLYCIVYLFFPMLSSISLKTLSIVPLVYLLESMLGIFILFPFFKDYSKETPDTISSLTKNSIIDRALRGTKGIINLLLVTYFFAICCDILSIFYYENAISLSFFT